MPPVQTVDGEPEVATLRPGYIRDYVSGVPVRATPEELDAVQVMAQRLVEDYGYPKAHLRTRPQFKVRRSPSDEAKGYPVDIAVFSETGHTEDALYLIVECKIKNRKEGVEQLKLYLDLSPAELGIWFNGNEHAYLRKVHKEGGSREYVELPGIPRYGQRIDDVGLYRRRDLKRPSNLRAVFRDVRNHLAGMATGIMRDEPLAREIINILFCKILDEQETLPEQTVSFRAGVGEPSNIVKDRIDALFERVKTQVFDDVFSYDEVISLDPDSLVYVVGELQNYCVSEADRDAIGDAFEVFIGPALRGAEGQFFTPRNVVEMMVEMIDPKPGDKIIDPACGSGGFLIGSLTHVWDQIRIEAEEKGWTAEQRARREVEVATKGFRGIDKDSFLAKVSKAYMALIGDGRGGIFCENSLEPLGEWHPAAQQKISLGAFNVVLTNPPFGSKIAIKGKEILSQYDLGHKWAKNKKTGRFDQLPALVRQSPPQLLFIERSLALLASGGRMGIVLPESIFGNPSYQWVVQNLLERHTILAVVSLPENLFKTSGKGGTHTKTCAVFIQKTPPRLDDMIFLGEARWCGHDSRGNRTVRIEADGTETLLDDVPLIASRYQALTSGRSHDRDHLGFLLQRSEIKNSILIPRYYDPEIEADLEGMSETHDLVTVEELVNDGVLAIATGNEVGKMAYGTGVVPFIRTSDISNWEIKADPKHGVSEAIFDDLKKKQDVRAGDILLVRDGTYLIGTNAIVTKYDGPLLYQSHIYKIRCKDSKKLDPFLLLALLNAPVVKRQIRSKQFTQDIIDTIGRRLWEVVVPIPQGEDERNAISRQVSRIVLTRAKLREEARRLSASGMADAEEPDTTGARFEHLASQWIAETMHMGSMTAAVMHPAYQQIIGMGPQAVPLILAELQRTPGHWFWALHAITQANPVLPESEGIIEEMAQAWISWGKNEGHLP